MGIEDRGSNQEQHEDLGKKLTEAEKEEIISKIRSMAVGAEVKFDKWDYSVLVIRVSENEYDWTNQYSGGRPPDFSENMTLQWVEDAVKKS